MNWEKYGRDDQILGTDLGTDVAVDLIGPEVIESAIECVGRGQAWWSAAESLLRLIASPSLAEQVASRLARETTPDLRRNLAELLVELTWYHADAIDYAEILMAAPDLRDCGVRVLVKAGDRVSVSEVMSRLGSRLTMQDLWSIYASLCGEAPQETAIPDTL